MTQLHNAGVTAGPFLVAGAQLVEELGDGVPVAQPGESKAPVGHAVDLGQCYQRLDDATQLLGLGDRSLNQLVTNQRRGHVLEHCPQMAAVTIQVTSALNAPHPNYHRPLYQPPTVHPSVQLIP